MEFVMLGAEYGIRSLTLISLHFHNKRYERVVLFFSYCALDQLNIF